LLSAAGVALAPAVGCDKADPSAVADPRAEADRKAMKPLIEKHREAATAKLAGLKAAGADAATAPPVARREPGEGLLTAAAEEVENAGLMVASAEWLTAGTAAAAKVPITPTPSIDVVAKVMVPGHEFDHTLTAKGMELELERFGKIKQVAAVRVRAYAPPKLATAGGEKRFEGAKASGDVIVYDAATGKRVGAFPFEVGQSERAWSYSKDEAAIAKDVEHSFGFDVHRAVKAEYAAYAANKPGPHGPGSAAAAEVAGFADRIHSEMLINHLGAGAKSVEIVPGPDGTPVVTIHADYPRAVTDRTGKPYAGVVATVKKVLGTDAEVRVVP
jgi:hypothetical protein